MSSVAVPLWQAAGALGAGAGSVLLLVLLSVALRRLGEATQAPAHPGAAASLAPAVSSPAPTAGVEPSPAQGDEAARVAAAIAVALQLEGLAGAPSPEAVAALAVALSLERGQPARAWAALDGSPWKLAGRISGLRNR